MILFMIFSLKASSLVATKTGKLPNCSAQNSKLLICNASRLRESHSGFAEAVCEASFSG
ncbi:hypothetical protein [Mesorhizobium sp. M1322]|uniref:hypothetical protein n=1 Tax=Mesorhizobium sp. M1322 TaxID=2957081 RepID=UPI00333721C6